jgi:hypothetical protein
VDSGSHFLVDYKLGTKIFLFTQLWYLLSNCYQILIFYFLSGVQMFPGVSGFHSSACELKMWWQYLLTLCFCTLGSFHMEGHPHSVIFRCPHSSPKHHWLVYTCALIVSVNVGHSQWTNTSHVALWVMLEGIFNY